MKVRKIISIILSTAICAFAVSGCSSRSDKPVSVSEETSVSQVKSVKEMKYVGLKVYDPVYVALDKGFFDDIDVELVDTVAGGATAVEMVSSGDVQGCLLSNMALCNAVNAGMPVIAVADIQSAFKEAPLEEFYVRSDSDIHSISELKGKKIAINLVKSSFHYTWLIELEKAGMTENDVQFVTLPFAEQKEALLNGTVDAIGLMQPYSGMARVDNNCRQLYTAVDSFGERQFCEILLNTKWASENEDAASAFVDGIAKAADWISNNQDEAKKIISKYTGIDAQYIDDYYFQPHASVNMSDAEYWLEYMKKHENVNPDLTVNDVATNKFNKAVK